MQSKTKVIPVQLEDGTTIHVEGLQLGGEQDVGIMDALPIAQLTGVLENIAHSVINPLKKAKPKKATVELGLTIGLESGKLTTLLVKGTGEANLKITLEWGEK